ncbi:MAG: glycosyltransferase [Bacteroidota bacterium]
MHVLYLSYDGLTDPLGSSQILPYVKGLVAKGYRFTIISFEKKERYETENEAIREQIKDLSINWIPNRYTKNPPVLSTISDIRTLWSNVKNLYKTDSFQLVHCRSYITALIGLKAKNKFGTKFLFDMRGFWADERIDGNIWNLKNPVFRKVYNYFKKKEIEFFTQSDYIISLTHAGKKEIDKLTTKSNTSSSSVQVIPCCVDNQLFDPVNVPVNSTSSLKNSLNISQSQFVLGYVGSIGTWYMLPEMISFFRSLLDFKPDSVFLFVTKERPDNIYNQFQSNDIDRSCIRVVASNRENMPSYINLFDWSIFFIKPVFSKQASSPTKQGEIMSMGKPIICNSGVGDTEEIINQYEAGIVIDQFDESTFIQAIEKMEKFQIKPERIREGSIAFFSLKSGVNNYANVYQACAQ